MGLSKEKLIKKSNIKRGKTLVYSKANKLLKLKHSSNPNHSYSLQSPVIVHIFNGLEQTNGDKQAESPAPYEFRPVSPTREEVSRMSFSDDKQGNKLLSPILPIPIRLSQPEAVAAEALLQLRQGQSG